VTGCGSTPAFTTDAEIVPSPLVTDTTTSPRSAAISRLKSSMFAMAPFNRLRANTGVEARGWQSAGAAGLQISHLERTRGSRVRERRKAGRRSGAVGAAGGVLGLLAGVVEEAGPAEGFGHGAVGRGRCGAAAIAAALRGTATATIADLPRCATALTAHPAAGLAATAVAAA
jgi:hypothetical protein